MICLCCEAEVPTARKCKIRRIRQFEGPLPAKHVVHEELIYRWVLVSQLEQT